MIDKNKLASVLWNTLRKFEEEDELTHRRIFDEALYSEHYWHNRQHIFRSKFGSFQPDEEDFYTANVYTPNGESIVAAISSTVPQVNFYPDDADATEDVITAQAYQKIATLIAKHNRAPILIARALYILYNQHFVAFWNYPRKSEKFGLVKKRVKKIREIDVDITACPECEHEIPESATQCPFCESTVTPTKRTIKDSEIYYEDTFDAKSRQIIKVFGPLHVRIAPYVQDQEDSPYLILDFEAHPHLGKKLYGVEARRYSGDYRRTGRSSLFKNDFEHLDTWKCLWLQPWVTLEDKEVDEYVKENYPDGVYCVFINDTLADIENQDFDDYWTINKNPFSNYIIGRPLGSAAISIQDAINELVNMSMDTVKHGIPQTFASPEVLDLNKYAESEIEPGKVWPTKQVPSGRSLSDFIFTTRTATLSQEVRDLYANLQQLGQLTTGAFPSIYGGILSGSRTASEYAQSRAQALQRLSVTWMMLKNTWADTIYKAAKAFAKNLDYDERDVQKEGSSFLNIWIRRTELTGRIGKVEPETDENLPVTWAQQRDLLFRLIEINSPEINSILGIPENTYIVKNALGVRELVVPGYQDKMKQKAEIQDLINGIDVPIDPLLDNHIVEAAECRLFLTSDVGLDLKITNPEAYQKVYEHFRAHLQEVNNGRNPA